MKRSLVLFAVVAGCHRPESEPPEVVPAPPPPPVCALPSALAVTPPTGSSSSLALARIGDRRMALVADEDDAALRMIDLETRTVVASAPLGAAAGHVIVDRKGRIHVSLPESDRVVELTVTGEGVLTECQRRETPPEPRALALFNDTLLVTSREALTMFGATKKTIAVSPDPSGILVTGSTALVAHRTGSLISVVALDRKVVAREVSLAWRDRVAAFGIVGDTPRFAVQAHALARMSERVMIPMVLAYPGDPHAHLAPPSAYGAASLEGIDGYFPHEAAISSIHPAGAKPRIHAEREIIEEGSQRVSYGRMPPSKPPCLLPRSAAVHGETLVVACLGIDRLMVYGGDTGLGALAHSERARIDVPSGPTAVAVDGDDAIVWSQFARALSVVSLTDHHKTVIVVTPERPRDVAWIEGRKTFHAPLAFDGRACASCHPDAGNDGLVWATPNGLLQPPVLAGRVDAPPFGWLGAAPSLAAHIGETMKRLVAKPMHKDTMDSLVTYLRALKRERRPLDALAKRGRALFVSTEVGCASCHYDDGRCADGLKHDVGTGGTFDTPSLTAISTSGPYMHDGRLATLRQVIALDTMGTTKHLSDDDVTALVAYLKTL